MGNRRTDIDILKGLAISLVILYHMKVLRYGYLGVDIFFVISGFLSVPGIVGAVGDGSFRYSSFIWHKVQRLLPLLLLVSVFSLLAGYAGMLPDDYENLAESVVATLSFSNNILADITTRSYWDISNDYKPLIHTWYVGVLFEFYLLLPLVVMAVKKVTDKFRLRFEKTVAVTLALLAVLSLFLYLLPGIKSSDRFFLLHCRFFELAAGALAGMRIVSRRAAVFRGSSGGVVFLLLVSVLCQCWRPLSLNVLLLLVVALTTLCLLFDNKRSRVFSVLAAAKVPAVLGVMSYSLYVCHQPLLAFLGYFRFYAPSLLSGTLTLLLIIFVSCASYYFIERGRLTSILRKPVLITVTLIVAGAAAAIAMHGGVVRDVPELDIRMDDAHVKMHAEYVDRIYSYDKDFPAANGRINVLAVGNSFTRDWCNVLLESVMADSINLSYVEFLDTTDMRRVRRADYIFFYGYRRGLPRWLWDDIDPQAEGWGIGTKNFGKSNGRIYRNRHRADYYSQTVRVVEDYLEENRRMAAEWKDRYIDMIAVVSAGDNKVRVFTDDRKFISQDTKHLTRSGARFYAAHIDFNRIFKRKRRTADNVGNCSQMEK